jgi:hypothetical protein
MPESMPSVTHAVIPVVEAVIRYIPVPNAFGPGDNFGRSKPWKLGTRALPKNGLKRRAVRVGVWWKGRRKQSPKPPFSATQSQIHSYDTWGKFLSSSRPESITAAIDILNCSALGAIQTGTVSGGDCWDETWCQYNSRSTVFQTSEQVTVLIEGSDIKIPDRERAYQSTANNSQPIKPVQPGSQSSTSRMKRGIRGRGKESVHKLGRSAC